MSFLGSCSSGCLTRAVSLLHSLCCCFCAGFFFRAPHTAQTSGSGTHLAAGIKTAAFSRDLSQRQGAAHQSATLETRSKRVCMTELCLYEGTVACQCSTWCNTMLFMGSCDGNRGISCSKVVFWSTTATRWSSPRSAHTKHKNVAKLSRLVFYFCPFNPSPYLFRGATVPPCGPSASQPAWCM